MGDITKDERFSHVLRDPRFKKIPVKNKKTKIDKRFQAMFEKKDFKIKYTMDKRGRPINHTSSEDLKKFYELSSGNESDVDEDRESNESKLSKNNNKQSLMKKNKLCSKSHSEESDEDLDLTDSNDFVSCHAKNKNAENESKPSEIETGQSPIKNNESRSKFHSKGSKGDIDFTDSNDLVSCHTEEKDEEKGSKLSKNGKEQSLIKKNKSSSVLKSHSKKCEDDLNFTDPNDLVHVHAEKLKGKNFKTAGAQFSENDVESEDSSDDDSDDEKEESDTGLGDKFDHGWGELDADASNVNEVTRRLALCNMDWDNVGIKTIMALCNSFKPDDGVINSVKIFPSAFGLQRMEEEKIKGPAELIDKTIDSDEKDELQKDSHYHREKLREYQIKRLKYFYAVIDCNSIETASRIYDQLDGTELGNSSVVIDLRYIPDDMEFNEEPSSILTEINMTDYKDRNFVNKALQEVKPDCTWDRTDPKRLEIMRQAFKDPENINVDDLNNVFAPYSSEEESDYGTELIEESKQQKMSETIAKYRSLLQIAEENDKKDEEEYHIEFSWDPGLKENTEKLVQEKLQQQNLTPFQEKLLKMKEDKKNKKRARKERLMEEDNLNEASANDDDFLSNTKMTESERNAAELELLVTEPACDVKKDKKDSFMIDTQDERFSAMYTSHHFHIDQTDSHFKNTKGVQAIIEEKQRKRKNEFDFTSNISGKNQPKHKKLSSGRVNFVKKKRYIQKRK